MATRMRRRPDAQPGAITDEALPSRSRLMDGQISGLKFEHCAGREARRHPGPVPHILRLDLPFPWSYEP
jgi:hypothetical protein